MKKLVFKLLGSSEQKWAKVIVGVLLVGAFAFIFGPNIYAQFVRETGDVAGWGYGYGYGYGYNYDDNANGYRIGGSGTASDYEYDYGVGTRAVVQLTISNPTITLSKVYDGNTTAAVTAGTLSGVVSPDVVTVTAAATYDTAAVGTGKTITVVYTLGGADAANYTKPMDLQVFNGVITSTGGGGGGGGGSYLPACTSVTYGDYAAACFAGYQYRAIASRTPVDCTMTVAQQDAAKKLCGADVPVVYITGQGLINYQDANNTANFIAREKNLVKKINKALSHRLSGRILLQVEEKGEAWYVYPINELRYYLGRPADAFAIMRRLSLGVSEKDYSNFAKGTVPSRLAGRILLRAQAHGEAYYVNPLTMKMSYLGRPADAFAIMRKFGLGITNANLHQIGIGEVK